MDIPNYLLFTATFVDGSTITQNAKDEGSVFGRNCFYDVLYKASNVADGDAVEGPKDLQLKSLVLIGENYPTFGVDLIDGHFEVNGVPFFQHSEPLSGFKLRYYRNVKQHKTFTRDEAPTYSAELGYELGWDAYLNGEKFTRFMRIVG